MKSTFKFLLLTGTFILGMSSVKADCDYAEKAELNREVANIKIKKEVREVVIPPEELEFCGLVDENGVCIEEAKETYFDVNILNLSEKFYAVVTNDKNSSKKRYYATDADENGIVSFSWNDLYDVTKLTIEIYSSDKTNCPNTRLSVRYETIPRINYYATRSVCDGMEDYYLCNKFVTYTKDDDVYTFIDKVNAEKEKRQIEEKEKQKSFWEKLGDFLNKNKVLIIVCVAVIVVVAGGSVYVIRKRRDL